MRVVRRADGAFSLFWTQFVFLSFTDYRGFSRFCLTTHVRCLISVLTRLPRRDCPAQASPREGPRVLRKGLCCLLSAFLLYYMIFNTVYRVRNGHSARTGRPNKAHTDLTTN